jgi:hypothetical protein
MGNGLLGWVANVSCIVWTCFIVVIFSLPNYKPVTAENMNYAAVITGGVILLSGYVRLSGMRISSDELNTIGSGTFSEDTDITKDLDRIWKTRLKRTFLGSTIDVASLS